MRRWKRERTIEVLTMHAHNRWSNYGYARLQVLETLGIPCSTWNEFQDDGSTSEHYVVPAQAFERVRKQFEELVDQVHEKMMGGRP